jgi:rubrerythrin
VSRKFQRRTEDFVCEHCGQTVVGDGYTNHCPRCLWSKHVDENPGDRAAQCGGLMQPVGAEQKRGEITLVHRCVRCGHLKRNRAAADDDFARLLAVLALGNRF